MNVTPESLLKSLDLFGYVLSEPAGATTVTLRVFLVIASADEPPRALHLPSNMDLSSSTISKAVRRLTDAGLVDHMPDATDRRRRRLTLSPFGAALMRRMRTAAVDTQALAPWHTLPTAADSVYSLAA